MQQYHTLEEGFKYKPDYEWPEDGCEQDCPRCGESLELIENKPSYYGKPWWCAPCQWQFSQDDLSQAEVDSKEEE